MADQPAPSPTDAAPEADHRSGFQNTPRRPNLLSDIRAVAALCARSDIFSWGLLWLMVLLVLGTVAQKYIGLYQAHRLYFDAWFLWVGGIVPLPGTKLLLTFIFAGLACKLALQQWTWAKCGTLIVHIGAMLLLLGGFITGVTSKEGSMVLAPAAQSSEMADYFRLELVIEEITDNTAIMRARFSEAQLKPDTHLAAPDLPFTLRPEIFHRNARPQPRPVPVDDVAGLKMRGMRRALTLQPAPRDTEEEANISALEFILEADDPDIAGGYGILEDAPIPAIIETGGRRYLLTLRHARSDLPFAVTLKAFRKVSYPGTDMARAYESDVSIQDGTLNWDSTISMNSPLRYKGYTLYQASFIRTEQGDVSVLAVVRNHGRMFPYISTIFMCVGLLIHAVLRLPRLTRPEDGGRNAA